MAQHNLLGAMFFLAAITVIGIPPLSGFLSKLFILEAARTGAQVLLLWPLILGATFLMMIALSRAGSRMFWHTFDGKPNETAHPMWQHVAVMMLLVGAVALTVFANSVSQYTDAIATQLTTPAEYISAVLQTGGSNE